MTDPFALERASIFDPAVIEILSRDDPMAVHKLRAFACPRDDIDESVIDLKELQRGCPLDQTSTASSTGSPGPHWKDTVAFRPLGHFGRLEALPLETLQAILEHLDLQTLTDLRCVSRRAVLVVDSLPLYKEIYSHAPDVLRAMLSTHSARHFDLWLVSRELRAEDCYLCGDFGPFFLLPGCARCCWLCLGKAEDTLPVSKAQAKESFELTDEALSQTPVMRSLPGRYGFPARSGTLVRKGPISYKSRTWLVNLWSAQSAARAYHGQARVSEAYMDSQRDQWINAYERQLVRRSSTAPSPPLVAKPPFPPYTRGVPQPGFEPRRFMTAIRIPTLDPVTGLAEWGLSCSGCTTGLQEGLSRYYDIEPAKNVDCQRMYTKQGVLEHAKTCEFAQKRWNSYEPRPLYSWLDTATIETEILDERAIPWMWDEDNPGWFFIKRFISRSEVRDLKKHTRRIRISRMSPRWRKELEGLGIKGT